MRSRSERRSTTDRRRPDDPQPTLSRRKRWLFRVAAMTLAPAVLLVALELGLRLAGVGHPAGVVAVREHAGRRIGCNNLRFPERFFPPNLARECSPFAFAAEKPAGVVRVFVLGASAALGIPDSAYNFGRILEVMLAERYPQTQFEVVTVAMAAINSHVVLPIARDCAAQSPDLFVVYLGNNEVVGPYGPGTVLARASSSLAAIRLRTALGATRIGQAAGGLARRLAPDTDAPPTWQGLAMFTERGVTLGDPALGNVYRHFERNLADICRVGRDAGAQVAICTVPVNLRDCAPFVSEHSLEPADVQLSRWQLHYDAGIAAEVAGDPAQAEAAYRQAAAIDGAYAALQFRLGRVLWQQEDHAAAKACFTTARELDTLRLRADTSINAAIRTVAQQLAGRGVRLVDAETAFAEASPHGVPGAELFHEHVHMTFSGNYLLARTVLQHVDGLLPESVRKNASDVLQSEETCASALAYTDWDRRRVASQVLREYLSQPPFTLQLNHNEQVRRIEGAIADLQPAVTAEGLAAAGAAYTQALARRPEDWVLRWKYGDFCGAALGDHAAAGDAYRAALARSPYYRLYARLGAALRNQDRFGEAAEMFRKGLAAKDSFEGHVGLGNTLYQLNEFDGAVTHYRAALAIKPAASLSVHLALAQLLEKAGDPAGAEAALRQSLEVFAEEQAAPSHHLLGLLLARQGRREEAIQAHRNALRLLPAGHPDRPAFQRALDALGSPSHGG